MLKIHVMYNWNFLFYFPWTLVTKRGEIKSNFCRTQYFQVEHAITTGNFIIADVLFSTYSHHWLNPFLRSLSSRTPWMICQLAWITSRKRTWDWDLKIRFWVSTSKTSWQPLAFFSRQMNSRKRNENNRNVDASWSKPSSVLVRFHN